MTKAADKPEKTGLELLRVPFAEHHISMLPKPMKKREEMDKLPKANCKICGGYHATSMMLHLAYVGHAALTDRLLDCDPLWTWEPLAVGSDGYPVIDKDGGMWIKLTVCGVTRLGYGDAQGKTGGDAMKERIGDALRNAAMRFGAALDLWHKGDLHVDEDDGKKEEKQQQKPQPTKQDDAGGQRSATTDTEYQERIKDKLQELFGDDNFAKKSNLMKLAEYTDKQSGEVKQGKYDYHKMTGDPLKWLCHKVEKLKAERQPGEEG